MKKIFISLILVCSLIFPAVAQEPSKEENDKKVMEYIEKTITGWEHQLELEDWQVFFVDSIMTHDLFALQDELASLQQNKITNTDLYQDVQDKWGDQMDKALRKVFNDKQWEKYQKNGARKAAQNRQKRRDKKQKSN